MSAVFGERRLSEEDHERQVPTEDKTDDGQVYRKDEKQPILGSGSQLER